MSYTHLRVFLVVGALVGIGAGCADDSPVSFDVGQKSVDSSVSSVKSDTSSSPVVSDSKQVLSTSVAEGTSGFSFWVPEDLRLETHNQGWTLQKKSEPDVNTPGAGSEDALEHQAPIMIYFHPTEMKANADFLSYPEGYVSGKVEKFATSNASCNKAHVTEGIMERIEYGCVIGKYLVNFTDYRIGGSRHADIMKIISSFSINTQSDK